MTGSTACRAASPPSSATCWRLSPQRATRPFLCTRVGMSSKASKGLNLWLAKRLAVVHAPLASTSASFKTRGSPTLAWSLPACSHRRQIRFLLAERVRKSILAYESLTTPVQIEGSYRLIELTMLASHGRAKIPDGDDRLVHTRHRPYATNDAFNARWIFIDVQKSVSDSIGEFDGILCPMTSVSPQYQGP